jgi:uncharacterized lipoprotein YmbA
MKSLACFGVIGLLCACAVGRPDHFYILSAQPQAAAQPPSAAATPVTLKVTLPTLVDRPELILNTSPDAVTVLEHERWGAPLADLVVQTLGQDIERRRGDLLVGGQGAVHSNLATVKITVDVVQMIARQGDRMSIEVHWRIVDARKSTDLTGNEVFSTRLPQDGYAPVAQALSDCLGRLAERLVTQIQ